MSFVFRKVVISNASSGMDRAIRSTLEIEALASDREDEVIQIAAIRKIAKARLKHGEFSGAYRVDDDVIVCDVNVIGMEGWWSEAKAAHAGWDEMKAEVKALYEDLEILDNAEALVDRRLRDAEMASKGET